MRRDKTKFYPHSGFPHRTHRSKRKRSVFGGSAQTRGLKRNRKQRLEKDRLKDLDDPYRPLT